MLKLLFLCVANSTRSQLAEALAREVFGDQAKVESAGSSPMGGINPYVKTIIAERGHNPATFKSKHWEDLDRDFLKNLDYVITLCSEEYCPKLSDKTKNLHWPVSNPVAVSASRDEILDSYRTLANTIETKLKKLKKEALGTI